MGTDINEYLSAKGYADHVVRGGLRGLVRSWAAVAEGLARSNCAYILYEEFLNDVDGRRILRECMERLTPTDLAQVSERVAEADRLFRENTVEISSCVWGDETAIKHGYRPLVDWYYYRRPKVVDEAWPDELL